MLPLSERQADILTCIVKLYNETGVPVGSAAVARQAGIDVSSATVRNVMAELEERELLYQPHVSAGRVPTSMGMRFYVDYLIQSGQLTGEVDGEWRRHLRELTAYDAEAIVRSAGHMISKLTRLTSIVSTPRVSSMRIKDVHLSLLSEQRVLVILIAEDGRVFNRVVRLEEEIEPASLLRMQNYLSQLVVGQTLAEVRRRVRRELLATESRSRLYRRRALELGQEIVELAAQAELFVEGAAHILEFAGLARDMERVRDLLRTLEERERMLEVLDGICEASRAQTLIGSEIDEGWGEGLSLIACGYFQDGEQVGLVGVLGPMRMDYLRMIPLVEHAALMLSRGLGELM